MERFVGKVFAIDEDGEKEGASFHIRTNKGREIWVTVRGQLPPVVKIDADVVVCGNSSAAMGGTTLERFAATEVVGLGENEAG